MHLITVNVMNVTAFSQLTPTLLGMSVLLLHYNGSSKLYICIALDVARMNI